MKTQLTDKEKSLCLGMLFLTLALFGLLFLSHC